MHAVYQPVFLHVTYVDLRTLYRKKGEIRDNYCEDKQSGTTNVSRRLQR